MSTVLIVLAVLLAWAFMDQIMALLFIVISCALFVGGSAALVEHVGGNPNIAIAFTLSGLAIGFVVVVIQAILDAR